MAVHRKTKNHMRSHKMISKKKSLNKNHQKGGSPASNLVHEALDASPHVKNDFVTSPRIREGPMKGGSTASDMVMTHLNTNAKTNSFLNDKSIEGDMNSLNLYQPSGGSRKSKGKSRKMRKMSGGGSDWISSQYSLGSYNQAEMSAEDVAKFSQSASGSRADYMNPPNLGLAGSGSPMSDLEGANVSKAGAPLV